MMLTIATQQNLVSPSLKRAALGLALTLLLSGCAEQRLRRAADDDLARGRYEDAVQALNRGVTEHPDSINMRSAQIQTRQAALQRLQAEAAQARARSDWDGAEQALRRALALAPEPERLREQLFDLQRERQSLRVVEQVKEAIAAQQWVRAQQLLQQGLQDQPQQPQLLELRRQLEDRALQAQRLQGINLALAQAKPISLDFRETSVRTVLDAIGRHSGINYLMDKDVRQDQKVTLLLRDSAPEAALDMLLSTQQLAKKVVDARTVMIYPNTPEKRREYQDQVLRVFRPNSVDARAAAGFLRAMLRVNEPFVDERANLLALRDNADNIQLAERLMELYDAGEPEVLLELEVLEISSRRLTELGVKVPDSVSITPLIPDGAKQFTLATIQQLNQNRLGVSVGGLLVNLKREVGDFSTLANPRIRVKHKEKARVLVGDKIPVISTTSGQTGFVSESINYLEVGLKLEVEPIVHANDEVDIKLGLEVSTLGTAVRTTAGALAYQTGTRNANTSLRLKDGETQLLAGLINKDERNSANRLPGLGDLPLLGRLFSSEQNSNSRSELVLAVTPRILSNVRKPSYSESTLLIGPENSQRLRLPEPQALPEDARKAAKATTATAATPTVGKHQGGSGMLAMDLPAAVRQGEEFEVAVRLAGVGPMVKHMNLLLSLDPKRLQLLKVEDTGAAGASAAQVQQQPLDTPGQSRLTWQRGAGAAPASPVLPLMKLRLRALQAGPARLALSEAKAQAEWDGKQWQLDLEVDDAKQLVISAAP